MKNQFVISILFLLLNSFPLYIHAESDSLVSLLEKFKAYQAQEYQEQIYVQVDKNYYLSGEFIRFKVYCLDAITQYPSSLSKVVYVELIDTSHTPLIQTKILLNEGKGHGDVFIPSNFKSGNYVIRGYTNWMKNYRVDQYFHSIVQIINPFIKAGLKSESNKGDIAFFPEGGGLVNETNSKIAFKATNGFGRGIDFSGRIVDDLGNVIVEFSPLKNGIGSFYFKPAEGRTYHSVVVLKDSSEIRPTFPAIKEDGLVMHINNLDPEDLKYEISSNLSNISGDMFLVGQIGGKIQFTEKLRISNGAIHTGNVKKDNFIPGIMKITLFNSEGIQMTDRLVFIYPKNKVNLQLKTDNKVFKHREKVSVNIFTSDEKGEPLSMDLSISVVLHNKYFDKYSHNIQSYQLLGVGLKCYIEDPDYYLDGQTKEVRQAMDNLMLTHAYERFLWEDLNTNKNQKLFIPEYRAHIITGFLTKEKSRIPAEGIFTYLSVPSKNPGFYAAKSKKGGELFFEMTDFTNGNEIIVQTNHTIDSIYQIIIDNPFSQEYSDFNIPLFDINESIKQFIEKASTNMQIQNAYLKYRPLTLRNTNEDSSTFYHPDSKYFLDDYTRFPVMEEVIREYISGVYVRHNPKGFQFKMNDMERKELFQEDPLILLDGVPVFDAGEIIELDPLKIEKIQTVKKRFLKGEIDYSGIVSFSTYNGDLEGYQLNKNALVLDYEGVQSLQEYSFPTYDSISEEKARMPDYRNVLYWNPQFTTDENGEAILDFYTSDETSVYEIRVEGITGDGRPVFGNSFIQVSDNRDP